MRLHPLSFIPVILSFALYIGCSSSTNNSTNPTPQNPADTTSKDTTFKAIFQTSIDGTAWAPQGTIYGVYDSSKNKTWINTYDLNGDELWIYLDSTMRKPGTYEPLGGYFVHRTGKGYSASSGSIILQSVSDSHASGSFQFQGVSNVPDTINVTNGVFDVQIHPGHIPF